MTTTKPTEIELATFTPGPWRYTEGGIIDNSPLKGHAGIEIADVYGTEYHDKRGPSLLMAESNARLVAASPDLLEACKLAATIIEIMFNRIKGEPPQECKDDFIQIVDAIKKATEENK